MDIFDALDVRQKERRHFAYKLPHTPSSSSPFEPDLLRAAVVLELLGRDALGTRSSKTAPDLIRAAVRRAVLPSTHSPSRAGADEQKKKDTFDQT